MPITRTRRGGLRRRLARQSWLLALVVVTIASTAIGAAASRTGSPRAAARAVPVQVARGQSPDTPTALGYAFAQGSVTDPTVATAPDVPGRPAVPVIHTMSMDAPIQGGLTAHQEQTLSARLRVAHQIPTTAAKSTYWTPAMGRTAAARAESWLGMPYSWAGGDASGPTLGRCEPGTGGDLDCHVAGFDCSGLSMYAWGSYASLPHLAADQLAAGAFHPTRKQLLPGDLVFFSAYLADGTGHVGIYAGHGMVIEAPQSGSVVRRTRLAEMIANDGVYRGAVRPLTGLTPTLTASHLALPIAGGTLTLRGAHLANVDAVHLGRTTVTRFVRHTDTAIVLRVPAHKSGNVAVKLSTTWLAQSRAALLTYAKPRPAKRHPVQPRPTKTHPAPPTTAPPTTAPPTSTPPTTASPTSTPPTTAPPTSTPPASTPPTSAPPKSSTPPPAPSSTARSASPATTTSPAAAG